MQRTIMYVTAIISIALNVSNAPVDCLPCYVILEWTTSLDTSSRTLFVREGGRMSGCPRHVERRVT